ncbi:MAG: hypothetical protein JKY65_02550 [Planctomycetes bacterium]|nr:hypothetical protein [Planctomycetota bacterium]
MRTRNLLPALLLLLPFAAGCPQGEGGGIKKIDQSSLVEVITSDDAKVLDPHTTSDGGNVKVIVQIYQTLVRVDPDDFKKALRPELAESWTVAPDGKSITFQIRKGVKFHDGADLDAVACKLSLDRLLERGFKLTVSPYGTMFGDLDGIEAKGHELTLTLKNPVAPVMLRSLSMFSGSIVSPKLLEATKTMKPEEAQVHVTQNAAGTGPFKLESFDPAAKVTRLKRFVGYWEGSPTVETIVFKQVADKAARGEYIKRAKGVILCDDVPRELWKELGSNEDLVLKTWWSPNVGYLGVSGIHEKTKELPLRRAIALAIERGPVVAHYEDTARPTFSLVAQVMASYDASIHCPDWDDDRAKRIAKAKELVKEAGAEGRKLTIYHPNQARPYLPAPSAIADTIRNQLKEIGLDVTVQGKDKNALFPEIETGKYELVLIGWTTDNGDPDNFYSPLADGAEGKASASNVSRVFDAKIHDQVMAARAVSDPQARIAAYRALEKDLQTRIAGYVPLVNTKTAVVYNKRLTKVEVDGVGHYRFHKAILSAK